METEDYEMRQRFNEQLKLIEQKDRELNKKHDTESRALKVEEQHLQNKQREYEDKLRELNHLTDMTQKKINEETEL